jgi:hypothetical protein
MDEGGVVMKAEKEFAIRKFLKSEDPKFLKACEIVKIQPTKRQASKWLSHKGLAWKDGRE